MGVGTSYVLNRYKNNSELKIICTLINTTENNLRKEWS